MRVEPLIADAAPPELPAPPTIDSPSAEDAAAGGAGFAAAIDSLEQTLAGAQRSEDAFAHGSGSLQDAVYERARADVALSAATACAQRLAQSLSAVLNMQV
ncbi:MAG TPA: flagellar hook-basal body complex protein FliE [Candidatus Cybelea sp.]|jgi:flagellar hook-basal body complex protein FliE|nr:flagellar hook-basal body complex protein FliE [Candidatus Cybelea sp.]